MPATAPHLLSPDEQTPGAQPPAQAHAAPGSIEQIYVTDCLYGDGRCVQPGFDIRSSSTDDSFLLRFALEYPQSEVPEEPADGGLRRLALLRIPGGKSALMHTVYFSHADRGRANSFFSHVLVHPALKAREALATWGSAAWATCCPADDGKRLSPLAELPPPGPIDDHAVTAFLQADPREANGRSPTCVYPERLRSAPAKRRELLRLFLRGCQLALQTSPAAARQRFYLLAEPGLSALLLYAAARLLPEALAARLTFSTWEHVRSLPGYKHARVVSTFTADAAAGLDEHFFTTAGYALDTFHSRFSPELQEGDQSEIEDWIDLAARGAWTEIDRIYDLLGEGNGVASFREAKQAYQLSDQLAAGEAHVEDLLAARNAPWGPALLHKYRARVWPLVRDAGLSEPVLAEAFADLLGQHLPELEDRAFKALRAGTATAWRPHWQLLHVALKENVHELREVLSRILPDPPFHPELRLGLLQELNSLQMPSLRAPARFQTLLTRCTTADLDLLAHSGLDPEWFVWALFHALVDPETAAAAVRHVHGGDDALLQTFWQQFRFLKNEEQRREVLAPLFPPTEEAAQFLSRSLKNHCKLAAETLAWLLGSLQALRKDWGPFWASANNLNLLLEAFRNAGPRTEMLWERIGSQINGDLLVGGDAYQEALLLELGAAKTRPGGAVPDAVGAALADWILLRRHFEKASAVPPGARQELIDACNRRGVDAVGLLARYFAKFVLPQPRR